MAANPVTDGEQPLSFPQTNVQVMREGVVLQITLAPGLVITQMLGEDLMNKLTREWLKTRQQIKEEMAVIQHVKQSRHN